MFTGSLTQPPTARIRTPAGNVVRTGYATSKDTGQTHQENYADEPIVAVHQ